MKIYLVTIFVAFFMIGCATTASFDSKSSLQVKDAAEPVEQPEEDEALVVVNGEEITISEYNDKLRRLSNYERARYRGEEGHRKFLEALIQQKVMVQKAREMGLDKNDEVQTKIAALMKEVTERVLIEALIKQEILDKVVVTDEEAKAYYDEHREEFKDKEKVKIRQIIAATEEEAQEILQELENGADFAELASRKSNDQSTAKSGEDPGYIERGKMPAVLENIYFSLEVGKISDAVKTNHGYYIVKLEDKKEASIKEFYEVSDEIKSKLIVGKQREEHQKWLLQLEEEAKIEVKSGFGESQKDL
jgi:EpsD family peptidyl-prolyl cis-trans isomerase